MKNNKFVLGFLLGLTFFMLLGAFTRDWDESVPTDSTVANQIDEYNRYLRVDTSDRLENMFYGFIAGENTLSQHAQYIQFYEQASVSQPSAAYGRLYTLAVGGKCELHWQDEDGDEIQVTTGGDWGGCNIRLLAGMDLLGSSTSDITINTDKFTVAGATGNTSVGGTFESVGIATLADASVTKTTAAPGADAQIANKKYVDDQDTADHPAYTGGESHVDGSGLIIKSGKEASITPNAINAITFGAAFPNAIVSVVVTPYHNGDAGENVDYASYLTAVSTSGFSCHVSDEVEDLYWMATGY